MSSHPATVGSSAEFTTLESGIVDHLFTLAPGYAVFLGLHRYDGLLPDLSRSSTETWAAESDRWLAKLRAIEASSLPETRRLDHLLLELLLEGSLFDLREARELDRNPMAYLGPVSLTAYMVREYAPLPARVDAMVHLLDGVPKLFEAARHRLDRDLPEPFLRLAAAMGGGLPSHFADAEALARTASPSLAGRVAASRSLAERAVHDYLEALKREYTPAADGAFRLGPARFQKLLWVREGLRTPFADIEAAGWADLRRNQARLAEIGATSMPPTSANALLDQIFREHPAASELVPTAQKLVDETKEFVRSKDLATIPEPAVCRVEETPSYGRALTTASMNPPGPFDVSGDEGIYFVTPVDPAWTPEHQEEWLRSLNDAMLRNITIHEVYPGHYLQFLHFRRRAGASLVQKVYFSSSFVEGWAHYCEQLAIEAGLGAGTPHAEVAQIHDALLRDCRLLASIGMHAHDQTLDWATELFKREGYLEQLPAEREAIRGTFNPEYFCYTLGKLAILDVRTKLLAERYDGSLHRFHDRLLGFGAPPVGVLEQLLSAV